jgi:hypothetical protein
MNTNIAIKKIPFFDATLTYIYFKNIAIGGLQDFSESINELFYTEEITPISVTVNGSAKAYKLWVKANQNVFEEVNWITTWFTASEKESSVSGYFMAVGGTNLKSLVSDRFICKVFDTAQARFCFVGEVYLSTKKTPLPSEWEQVQLQINNAIQLCGLEGDNLIKQHFLVSNYEAFNSLKPIIEHSHHSKGLQVVVSGNQHQTAILGGGIAIKPLNAEMVIEIKDAGKASQIKVSNQDLEYVQLLNASALGAISESSDYDKQISQTMDAVADWMAISGLNWSHLCRGIAYFTEAEGAKLFKALCKERKIPLANILAICLDLKTQVPSFDLELDFVKAKE